MSEQPSVRVPSQSSPNPWLKFLIRLAPRGEAAAKLWDELHARREKRMIEMGDAMAEAAAREGTDAEELLERIAADERLGDLLMMAVEAAAKARLRQTIAALGRAVASGVLAGDDASIDELELVIALLGELSAVHIRALLALAEGAERPPHHGTKPRDELLSKHLGTSREANMAMTARLERLGIIWLDPPGFGGWGMTSLGFNVLEYLQDPSL